VIYIQPRDEPALLETGDNSGDMTSELKPRQSISEFVAASPKNYAYKTVHSLTCHCKTVCKVRGITLNYNVLLLLNFDRIRDMILKRDENEAIIVHTKKKIKREKGDGRVNSITEPEDKANRV
jgi:hypothetical protein